MNFQQNLLLVILVYNIIVDQCVFVYKVSKQWCKLDKQDAVNGISHSYMYVCLFVWLVIGKTTHLSNSVYFSFHLYIFIQYTSLWPCPSIWWSGFPSAHPYIHQSMSICIQQYVHVHTLIYLSINLSNIQSIHPSSHSSIQAHIHPCNIHP